MNFEKVRRQKRKAISPVLATVILIAITLIAAIAIAGFVFGLFGSFTSSPQLTAVDVNCTLNATPVAVCTMNLNNTGSGNADITSCSVQIGGVAVAGTVSQTKVAGNTQSIAETCTTASATGGVAGSTATGTLVTASGNLPFSGVWN
jgi:flagellin-like protein